jgi:hypothetical protein
MKMYGWDVKLKEIPKLLWDVLRDTTSSVVRRMFKKRKWYAVRSKGLVKTKKESIHTRKNINGNCLDCSTKRKKLSHNTGVATQLTLKYS